MLGKLKVPSHLAFGQVLRQLRKERNLSQEGLAFEANIQSNYASLIERDINQPTIITIFKLAAALGVKPSEIVVRIDRKNRFGHMGQNK